MPTHVVALFFETQYLNTVQKKLVKLRSAVVTKQGEDKKCEIYKVPRPDFSI